MRAFSIAEDVLRRQLKGTRLEAPARALVEWRRPTWRQDRLDNDRLRLLIAYTFREDSCGVDVGAHKGIFMREMRRGRRMATMPPSKPFPNWRKH